MAHVATTVCDSCNRPWTGKFEGDVPPDTATCRDCIKAQSEEGGARIHVSDSDYREFLRFKDFQAGNSKGA